MHACQCVHILTYIARLVLKGRLQSAGMSNPVTPSPPPGSHHGSASSSLLQWLAPPDDGTSDTDRLPGVSVNFIYLDQVAGEDPAEVIMCRSDKELPDEYWHHALIWCGAPTCTNGRTLMKPWSRDPSEGLPVPVLTAQFCPDGTEGNLCDGFLRGPVSVSFTVNHQQALEMVNTVVQDDIMDRRKIDRLPCIEIVFIYLGMTPCEQPAKVIMFPADCDLDAESPPGSTRRCGTHHAAHTLINCWCPGRATPITG